MNQILKNFKVVISAHSKNHAFRLAEGLANRYVLDKIYTMYPKFKVSGYKIPKNKIVSFPLLGAIKYINMHYTKFSDDKLSDFFSFLVALNLKKESSPWFFHAFSGYCEAPMRKAKKLGAITVVDRGCPHIDEQMQVVAEEKSLLLKKKFEPEHKYVYDRMKREYEMADYIVVPSKYSQKSFIERGFSPEKVLVVPLSYEKLVSVKSEPKNLSRFTVLCTGGNFYRKGLFYLLEAWQKLNLSDAELIFKGNVPKEFEHLLNAKNITRITKYLSDEEMGELYGKAHICVFPSLDDGFGMVATEAMAAGLPVVISENVGMADAIENGKDGFVVPIRSSDAIAEKIKFFYNNPEKLKEMSKAAIEKSKFYSPEEYTKRITEAYKSILKGRSLKL